ncbi:MAG: AMP-binding protein, partial [Syntrophales bacterium]|nr:AMP-binding protein [Syntrophales bacterium]
MKYEFNQRTLGYILEDKAKRNKEKVLLYFKDREYTYEETNTYANRVANGYLSLGIKKGDVVVAMLPNSPEFIFHWFGLAKLGAIDSPINTAYKGDLLRHVINISGAKVILIHEEFLDRIKFIEKELPNIEKVIVFSPQKKEINSNLRVPVIPFERLLEGDSRFSPPEEVRPHDPLQIIYTSGTTGPSKGAILPHHALYL